MKYVTFVVIGCALAALALCAQQHIWLYGAQGYMVLGLCTAPLVLIAATWPTRTVPRWASAISAICLLLAAIKTTNAPFDNIMMAAALGALTAIALVIKPARR